MVNSARFHMLCCVQLALFFIAVPAVHLNCPNPFRNYKEGFAIASTASSSLKSAESGGRDAAHRIRETDLYKPVKAYLEGQGYEVKGEVGAADIAACRDGDDPLIVELKTGFSLALFHQAVARQGVTDAVYIAVPQGKGRPFLKALKNNIALCRRLGLGLIVVRLKDGFVTAHLDPAPYSPRQSKPRKDRLLKEFSRRVGDPNTGGSTRRALVTAYRQDALKCVKVLLAAGPLKAAHVAMLSGTDNARRIMADDHYGWFERVHKGIYQLGPKGLTAAQDYDAEMRRLDVPPVGSLPAAARQAVQAEGGTAVPKPLALSSEVDTVRGKKMRQNENQVAINVAMKR
jgi:hypothetical protein